MGSIRRIPSHQSLDPSAANEYNQDDSALEGVAANVKLLLKLIQDHKDACHKEKKDGRRMLRVATMMAILDNIKSRIQKCQAFGLKGSEEAELRRGWTDFKPLNAHQVPREKHKDEQQQQQIVDDEIAKLRKELNTSLVARKSLEVMCSSLGREKEIIASELTRKVHLLNETEELINDLKAQNESLLEKLQEERREKRGGGGGESAQGNSLALQARNKTLSEQLLRSLDGYRSLKRRYREAREESILMHETMDEIGVKVRTGLDHIRGLKERVVSDSDPPGDIQEEITKLDHIFECLGQQIAKHEQKKGERLKTKEQTNTCQPPVVT